MNKKIENRNKKRVIIFLVYFKEIIINKNNKNLIVF
jgi:hypothetical protein